MSTTVDLVHQRLFGHYEILARLGSGGMGDVYRAKDLTLGRQVAIKVLREPIASDRDRLNRFEQEARAASALNHPNIVTIYEIGKKDDTPYIAMELVEGTTLRDVLMSGPLQTRRALQLAVQAADGLAQAHAAGVVHRDLKPENIIVTSDRRVKILDFGLAKLVAPAIAEDAPTGSLPSPGTDPGLILGTVGYMSPEQARGHPVDFRSDQFSCGSILYEMSTGRPAFRRESAVQTLAAIIEDDPQPVGSLNPGVPPPLRWIIERCLAKEPERRYGSTRDLARDLADVLDHLAEVSSGANPVPTRVFRPRYSRLVVGALAALGCAAAGALWLTPPRAASSTRPLSVAPTVKVRRSVAVIGFKNLSGRPEAAWLSTALAEMLTTELAAGGKLRTIPVENVGRMKLELSLSDAESLARDTLARVGRNLGTDMVLLGSYVVLSGDQIRLDLRLQDVTRGEMVAAVGESGTQAGLVDLVARAGSHLRQALGVGEPMASEAGGVKARAPSNLEAQRLYAEGMARLRVLDALPAKDLFSQAAAADPDSPIIHSALADAWSRLGYDAQAKEEARKAFERSTGLSPEERLWVEARHHEAAARWDKATDIYRALVAFFPDNLEYHLRLASAQVSAGKARDAAATLDAAERAALPAAQDPRIDLARAEAAQSLGDYKREQAVASRAAALSAALGARLLVAQARLLEAYAWGRLGEPAKASEAAEAARLIYAQTGDRGGVASVLNRVGGIAHERGDLSEALRAWEESLAIRREIGHKGGMAAATANIALVLWARGDLVGSRRMLDQALALDRELGNRAGIAADLVNLAPVLLDLGDLEGAGRMADQALRLGHEVGDDMLAAVALRSTALVLAAEGDIPAAGGKYDEAIPVLRRTSTRGEIAEGLLGLGQLRAAQGELAAARRAEEEALALANRAGNKLTVAQIRVSLAQLSIQEGHAQDADGPARAAAELFGSELATDKQALTLAVLAQSLVAQARTSEAAQVIERATALSAGSQNPQVRLAVKRGAARVQAGSGEVRSALRGLGEALAESVRYGLLGVQLEIRLAIGEIEISSGRAAEGRPRLQAVERDARARGFGLIARQAAALTFAADLATLPPSR